MAAEWYYAKGKEKVGPLTAAQLKQLILSGELTRTDMVWKEGMGKWTPAGQVDGLFDAAPSQAVRPSVPPPLPTTGQGVVATAHVAPSALIPAQPPNEMKAPAIGMFVVSGLALLSGLAGVLGADHPVIRILLALGLVHNIAAVVLAANVVRLRNHRLAVLSSWLVMTCWVWNWLTNVTHGITLLGMALAVSVGVWAFLTLRRQDVQRAFDADPPLPPLFSWGFGDKQVLPYALDPATRFPWPISERSSTNPKLQWAKIAAGISGGIGILLTLDTIVLGGPGIVVSWWFLLLSILILVLGVYNAGRLHGRWLPVDGQPGWVEFLSGNIFKREDGTVGTFFLLKNQKFIDILVSGHLVDSWKILSRGTGSLEIQDMAGGTRSLKKSKTLEEKQASFFHQDRTDDLPGSWVPIDGSGKWVQFTKDGALVFSDGRAGRYTVSGEEPNEIIRGTMADGTTCEYRLMSLSKTQLVIVEGTEARTYSRHGQTKSAVASASQKEQEQGPPGDTPTEQGASGGVGGGLGGVWNWLTKWKCPKCGQRAAKKTDTSYHEKGQRVQTGWDSQTKTDRQMVYSYGVREETFACKACGHQWVERSNYSGPA